LIFILFFVVYTDARKPSDFCNKKESHAEYYIFIDYDGNIVRYPNKQFQQPSTPIHDVYQDNFPLDLNEPVASSSGRGLDIDLNE